MIIAAAASLPNAGNIDPEQLLANVAVMRTGMIRISKMIMKSQ